MKTSFLAVLLLVLLAGLMLASLLSGPVDIDPGTVLRALVAPGTLPPDAQATILVTREVRLPRTLLAALTGAALGLAGAAVQGYLRNPLAEPGVLGTSSSAALGAVVAMQSGLAIAMPWLMPVGALTAAALSVVFVLAMAGPRGSGLTLILSGIALSSIAAALTSVILTMSPNPFAAMEALFWLMGSLTDRSMDHVFMTAPFVLLGMLILRGIGRDLDALTLGEDAARALGVDISRLKLRLVFGCAALVGSVTAVAGAVGFVGLVVPHMLRPLVRGLPSALLPLSSLGGAVLVVAADLAIRLVTPGQELKLGVLTALIGAPLFLHLVWKSRREAL